MNERLTAEKITEIGELFTEWGLPLTCPDYCLRRQLAAARERVEALEGEVERLREHTDALEANWQALLDGCMNAIRAVTVPDGSVPEIVEYIEALLDGKDGEK